MKIIENYDNCLSAEIIEITAARYLRDYKIDIVFQDNSRKIVDFEPFLLKSLHPSIAKYLDKALFKKFAIKDGNLNWNDYDLIFPIADLYSGEIN
jgi:hypothetical protein